MNKKYVKSITFEKKYQDGEGYNELIDENIFVEYYDDEF